jgi:hypothetical protein
MSQMSTGLSHQEKQATIAVPPEQARHMLQVSMSHLYGLMRTGELESFHSGRARRVTVASIRSYIERQLVLANSAPGRSASVVIPPRRERQQPGKRA